MYMKHMSIVQFNIWAKTNIVDENKFDNIFISGDGTSEIKNYIKCFPKALFVLDKYHYKRKHLSYIFKDNTDLKI